MLFSSKVESISHRALLDTKILDTLKVLNRTYSTKHNTRIDHLCMQKNRQFISKTRKLGFYGI